MHIQGIPSDQVLLHIMEGNRRFVAGKASHPNQSPKRRAEVLAGQYPLAAVLACADSRMPPEVIFDQGIGDLFVIRNAGNIVDDVVLGSIEFAVEYLNVPLVMVLGHTDCGAVSAAVQGGIAPGHIGSIVDIIQPAVDSVRHKAGDVVLKATLANVQRMVDRISTASPLNSKALSEKRLVVAGALYHLDTGEVKLL